ncbi:hypothetical protein ACFL59_12200 [Planctomycetota bacterium]
MDVLPKRFGKYGLTLHPEKTRLVPFQRPRRRSGQHASVQAERLGTFDLLGFTHYWARSRRGYWVVKRKTAPRRLSRALRSISQWCRRNRHQRVKEQHKVLVAKLRGHCEYYGLTGNSKALCSFRSGLQRAWRKWLNRRSQRGRMPWTRFKRLLRRYSIPPARPVHSIYCRVAKAVP